MFSYQTETLPNGVRILTEVIDSVRSAVLGIWVATGFWDEKFSESGAAHFIEHMFFKGTHTDTAAQLAVWMDAIGGQLNAFIIKECTCFYVHALDSYLMEGLDILTGMFFDSKFAQEDVETERGVILEEIGMYRDDPSDVCSERLAAAIYQGTPLAVEVGVLPKVHGSGLFTRGQTQVLSVCTLNTLAACQKLDIIWEEDIKRYMHHYNFPGYSVGEAKGSKSTNRREYGHGALAERALLPVIPSEEEFPYAIRVVSEVLSSNGSTSQGSICGFILALMDAGVPIKAPVAGISCGLIQDDEGGFTTFIDI